MRFAEDVSQNPADDPNIPLERISPDASPEKHSMKVIYIAGPFRGSNAWEIESNIRRAEALALKVWQAGFAVICPHTNTRFFQGAAPDNVWLEGDLALLERCDSLLTTPDWMRSAGARIEVEFARKCGIPVFETLEALFKGNINY